MPKPIEPDSRPKIPSAPKPLGPSQGGGGYAPAEKIDPSGEWTRFLQQLNPGQPITPQEVKQFQMGIMKWFNIIIARENRTIMESMKKMRKSWEE